jgi:isoleucyl-tRNA synthetase
VIYARLQWFMRMDEGEGVFTKDKAPRRARQTALEAIERPLLPRERQGAPARHDRQPARLVHLAPAQLGRADPFFLHGIRANCTRAAGDPRPGRRIVEEGGIGPGAA